MLVPKKLSFYKKAVVHKNILQFKKGYKTELGERGINLQVAKSKEYL